MNETINLTWKELCLEVKLRQMGKRGEWDIPNDLLAKLFLARAYRMPMVIQRTVPEDLIDPMQDKGWIG